MGDTCSWPHQFASQETQEGSRHHIPISQHQLIFVQLHLEADGWYRIDLKPGTDDCCVD